MFAPKYFTMSHSNMPIPELIPWLNDTATLQEAHPFHHSNWPDWVPGASRFRQHASALSSGLEAAKNKEKAKVKELEDEHAKALMSININATYIVMRSLLENNESLFHNVGYQVKEQTKRSYTALASLKPMPMVIKVKKGPEDGSIAVTFTRDPAAGLYHLQFCKGEPTGEDSWHDGGLHKNCRVIKTGLDLASWYYFRGRSHGDDETGPWSKPAGIIVT